MSDADTAPPVASAPGRPARPRRARLPADVVSALAATVGIAAIVGGYLGSTAPDPSAPAVGRSAGPQPDVSTVVRGAYRPEPGPFGLQWVWLSDRGSLTVHDASGRSGFVGVLATSLRRPRTVQVGDSPRRSIGTAPRAYLIGPFRLGAGDIPIRVSPGAERASAVDPRRTSVFVSTPVLTHTPFAAIPSKGFYPAERADNRRYNWMSERGILELAADPASDGVAAVRLRMWSATPRRVRIRADVATRTVRLAARRVRSVIVDGVRMRSGRGRLVLATDAPTPSAGDSRRLALQLLGVARVR